MLCPVVVSIRRRTLVSGDGGGGRNGMREWERCVRSVGEGGVVEGGTRVEEADFHSRKIERDHRVVQLVRAEYFAEASE